MTFWPPFMLNIIIVVVFIRHQLGVNRLVSASSNNRFEDLPSRIHPFGVEFNIMLYNNIYIYI